MSTESEAAETKAKYLTAEGEAVKADVQEFVRFNVGQRVEHIVMMVSFIALVVTGLSQKYYTSGWGEWLILRMGGIDTTRLIHRIFGLMFSASLVYHLGMIAVSFARRKASLAMMPTLKDARDIVITFKYYLGLSEEKPRFDRYDYKQKFEYLGILFGGAVMIISGFVLFFPVWFTGFLPGEVVPISKEFHRNEALLAVLTIVIWHMYSAHLRPGIFPGDATIFTGKISKKRIIEEHPLEYERLTGKPAIEEHDEKAKCEQEPLR